MWIDCNFCITCTNRNIGLAWRMVSIYSGDMGWKRRIQYDGGDIAASCVKHLHMG
jgi:hypothetical protein